MAVGAIIVGAGSSARAGFDKVFALLGGQPVLAYSVDPFQRSAAVDRIVLVLSAANFGDGEALVASRGWSKVIHICQGGSRRQDSVAAGLAAIGKCDWVLIHDAARPLLTTEMIERGLAAVRQTGAAVAAVPVVDTIKVVSPEGVVRATPERMTLWAVQTPQVFSYNLISAAYREASGDFTDDAGLLEQAGHEVRVFEGSPENLKITLPGDLALAEFLLERRCRESA